MNWQEFKINELRSDEKGSLVSGPFGSNISAKFFVEGGVPVIRGNNLSLGRVQFIDDGYVYITESKAHELRNCVAKAGDIIITAAGTLGQIGLIPDSTKFPFYIISNKQLRLRVDKSRCCPKFLYFYLSSPSMRAFIVSQNKGSSVPLLTLGIVRNLPVRLPEITIQRRIAAILTAYDDLFEINKRRIALLEKMAEELYREWFVRMRFPGHQDTRLVKGVPEGWIQTPIRFVFDYLEGPGIRNWQYQDSGFPFINIRLIQDGDIDISRANFISDSEALGKYRHFQLREDDFVVSTSGTLGRGAVVQSQHLPLNRPGFHGGFNL